MLKQSSKIETFRALHQSGCFVLPNPWDAGSAFYLEHLGFKALATTSAGFAFSKALPDGPEFVTRDVMLEHFRELVEATSLPVNADFQNGYADDPEGVAESVRLCVQTGVAGLSIEDNSGQSEEPLYDFDLAVERIKAARAAIDGVSVPRAVATGSGDPRVVLTARCEAYLVGTPDPFNTSIERLVAFADAGADCLYAPGVTDAEEISAIVDAVAPKPVNVLVSTNNCHVTVAELADLGVRRISIGGALARAAWAGFIAAAQEIQKSGSFASFAHAAPFGELNDLFLGRSRGPSLK
ncbi:MAG TPA: isocitrate lyase/phosphoenolpyruvate mutase family protein [Pyrinomonadaceae bacterium]|nr:isocitrate lyase/phosphoenolpyruvate mutase family protein [Pyrinomonadaceae bacterium]